MVNRLRYQQEMAGIIQKEITKFHLGDTSIQKDAMAIEEPLEIILKTSEQEQSISITMRSPGADEALASGFLFTEGIIKSAEDIQEIVHIETPWGTTDNNRIRIELKPGAGGNLDKLDRHFYTSSSCGVCGKSSIEAIKVAGAEQKNLKVLPTIGARRIAALPDLLRHEQAAFEQTGGLHACACFTANEGPLWLSEDVGRHNALDKLVGKALLTKQLPLETTILLLSGRASFELIQKAVMAGIPCVAAVGAPSSLAVELAEEFGVTLIGFLKHDRMNIYTHSHRIINDL